MTQVVHTRLPEKDIEAIQVLIDEGYYSSTSDLLRAAARDFIRTQRGSLKGKLKKEQLTEEDKAEALVAFAKERGWEL
ncbi:MAG: ribbon-helix-helix domain-containing protein [archaeon]